MTKRLEQICKEFSIQVEEFLIGLDMSDDLFLVLYEYYFDDMPYTIQTGDDNVIEWVHDRFHADVYDEYAMEI